MIKYLDTAVVMQEVPDEITLALEITNCPHRCKNCHSSWLAQDIGEEVTAVEIDNLLKKYPYVSCICFMGGDADHNRIAELSNYIRGEKKLKVAMYSGDDEIDEMLLNYLDYYKVGHFNEELGPLNKKTTNQRMYRIEKGTAVDITNRFWLT